MSTLCTNCGTSLRPGARFCKRCGDPVPHGGPPPPQSKGPRLVIREQGNASRTVPLLNLPVVIGRNVPNCVEIQNNVVSRQHARLERRGNEYWITDLNSTNGISINGQKVQSIKLNDGDIIRIGDQQGNSVGVTFHRTAVARPYTGTINLGKLNLQQKREMVLGREPSNDIPLNHPSVSRRHAKLQQTAQGHQIRDLGSPNGTFVNGQQISGVCALQHGDTVQIGPFKLIYDHGSLTQFTTLNNYRLDAQNLRREVSLVGRFSPNRLWYWLTDQPTQKVILNDISLSVYPKEFVALVGGSGAGKSTLIKALSGFVPADGQVLVNNEDLYGNFAAYRSILGYVPQDDIIHGQLTARSALTYAAKLRLPDASPQDIKQRIEKVLDEVEMTEHQHKQVNRLSGGQRKRVSIAVELLAEPGLFFLDEPTSGLDPGLEKKMMYTLRQQADTGRTILLVTHATANIDQCTQVAFLADGRLMYFGPPQEALAFFGATDFSDIYTRLSQKMSQEELAKNPLPPQLQPYYQQAMANQQASTNGKKPRASDLWAAHFQNSADYQKNVADRLQNVASAPQPSNQRQPSRPHVSPFQQFWVLTRRYFELIRRDYTSLFILLAIMPIIAFLLFPLTESHDLVGQQANIGSEIQEQIVEQRENEQPDMADERFQGSYVVVGSTQRLLFMLALAVTLLGLFGAAYEIIKEGPIYNRERMVNLGILPYLFSKVAVLALFALLQCFLLLSVVGLDVTYPQKGILGIPAVAEMYITLFLATLASISLGLCISAFLRSKDTIIYVILLVLFGQILFAGAIFELPDAAQPISYLTTTRWTLEALGSTVNIQALKEQEVSCVEFENKRTVALLGRPDEPCQEGQIKMVPDYEFNVDYSGTVAHLLSRWLVLGGFTLLFCGLTFVAQKRKDVV